MKNRFQLVILTLAMGISFNLSAQTVNAGTWMIGGSAGFSSQKIKNADASTTYLNLNPTLGYFVADDWGVGLSINFNSTSYDGESDSSFGLGPFVRYYFTDPIYLKVGLDLDLDKGGGTLFTAAVGYSWFISSDMAVEPNLFFSLNNGEGETSDFTVFGLGIGIQAFPGQ